MHAHMDMIIYTVQEGKQLLEGYDDPRSPSWRQVSRLSWKPVPKGAHPVGHKKKEGAVDLCLARGFLDWQAGLCVPFCLPASCY